MTTTPPEARAQIVNMVRDFVRREVEPVAAEHDREDTIPYDLIDRMKELGSTSSSMYQRSSSASAPTT